MFVRVFHVEVQSLAKDDAESEIQSAIEALQVHKANHSAPIKIPSPGIFADRSVSVMSYRDLKYAGINFPEGKR